MRSLVNKRTKTKVKEISILKIFLSLFLSMKMIMKLKTIFH